MSRRIVFVTSTLSPAAGGLAAAVPQLVRGIAKAAQDHVDIVGVEDRSDPKAALEWGPQVHAQRAYGPLVFGYAPGISFTLDRLVPDVTDVHGLWTYASSANYRHHRRYGTPYVVTPHGMLDPWSRMRSRWKKRAVRIWFEDAHLSRAACLRATAEMEAEHFRSFGLRNPIAIVPNGVDVPKKLPPRPASERRRILFLSRIHPKKGLAYLLRAWAGIEEKRPDWDLVIAGPDELNHTAEMKRLAHHLELRRVQWLDAVRGEAKSAIYRSADLVVLPTHAENFGLVIAEALAHEVPVITTRNAPWSGLEGKRCGWWIALEDSTLQRTLAEATALSSEALHGMGARGRTWMEKDFDWDRVAQEMLSVYSWILGQNGLPASVHVN